MTKKTTETDYPSIKIVFLPNKIQVNIRHPGKLSIRRLSQGFRRVVKELNIQRKLMVREAVHIPRMEEEQQKEE